MTAVAVDVVHERYPRRQNADQASPGIIFVKAAFGKTQPVLAQKRRFVQTTADGGENGKKLFCRNSVLPAGPAFKIHIIATEAAAVFIIQAGAGENDVGVVCRRPAAKNFQSVVVQPVVGIDKHHVTAGGNFQPPVAGGALTGVALGQHFHPAVPFFIPAENLQTVVGRAVVNADYLRIGKSLVKNTVEAGGQKTGSVVNGNDNGNFGHQFFLTTFSSGRKPNSRRRKRVGVIRMPIMPKTEIFVFVRERRIPASGSPNRQKAFSSAGGGSFGFRLARRRAKASLFHHELWFQ